CACYCALNLNENPAQFGIFFSANRLNRNENTQGESGSAGFLIRSRLARLGAQRKIIYPNCEAWII
ncbi:MAG: hypothetical protein BECKG1743E_GA0114224_102284, partial [Candidatus Kentron sp. G]